MKKIKIYSIFCNVCVNSSTSNKVYVYGIQTNLVKACFVWLTNAIICKLINVFISSDSVNSPGDYN